MAKIRIVSTFLFFLSFFLLFSCISLWRFNIGQVFYYDMGIFARPLWEIAHGLPPLIIHKSLGEINFLGDHFVPSIYLLAPIFLLPHSIEILLLEQALALSISGFLIYLIGRAQKLSLWMSLAVSFVFFIFAGTANTLVTDWHTEATASVFLLLFIYMFFYKKNYMVGIFSAIVFLGWKESNALTLLFSLIPFYILKKQNRRYVLIIGSATLVWFLFVTKSIIPSFIHQPYYYSPSLPTIPHEYITQFYNSPQKIQLIFQSFASFGFMPLIAIPFLFSILGEFAIRFIPTQSHFQSFTLGMHYNIFLGVFLSVGTLYSLSIFKGRARIVIMVLILIGSIVSAKKITSSPIFLATNTVFWKEWSIPAPLLKQITCVPTVGSVMSQNNILPHLISRREKVYLLSKQYARLQPDYIVLDISPGQNINNYYSGEIYEYAQVSALIASIKVDKNYTQDTYLCKNLLLFKKRNTKNIP